jgi:hypothetical protein
MEMLLLHETNDKGRAGGVRGRDKKDLDELNLQEIATRYLNNEKIKDIGVALGLTPQRVNYFISRIRVLRPHLLCHEKNKIHIV